MSNIYCVNVRWRKLNSTFTICSILTGATVLPQVELADTNSVKVHLNTLHFASHYDLGMEKWVTFLPVTVGVMGVTLTSTLPITEESRSWTVGRSVNSDTDRA